MSERSGWNDTWDRSANRISIMSIQMLDSPMILLMAEILHHLGCMKPYKQSDELPINWCRISSINSSVTAESWLKVLHHSGCRRVKGMSQRLSTMRRTSFRTLWISVSYGGLGKFSDLQMLLTNPCKWFSTWIFYALSSTARYAMIWYTIYIYVISTYILSYEPVGFIYP